MEEKCLVMWLNITLNEESFKLHSHTVKCLTLVSRYFANTLKNYIQQNYWFDLSSKSGRRLTYYSPINQKRVMNISEIAPSTKKVVFCYSFNKPVDSLIAPNLVDIEFGLCFRQPINKLFLPNLTNLKLGWYFNQSIDNLLLPNLTHLRLGFYFNYPIQSLPPKVQQVIVGGMYNYPVDHLSKQIQFQKSVYKYKNGKDTTYQYKPK